MFRASNSAMPCIFAVFSARALDFEVSREVLKTLLITGEGWDGLRFSVRMTKGTGAVLSELRFPGMTGSLPMTYMVTSGRSPSPSTRWVNPAEVISYFGHRAAR